MKPRAILVLGAFIAILLGSVLFTVAPRAARGAGTVDQEHTGGNWRASLTYTLAQTFTVGRDGSLDQVSVAFIALDAPPSGTLTIQIRPVDADGVPLEIVYTSLTRPANSLMTGGFFADLPLSPPVPVAVGTRLALVIIPSGSLESTYSYASIGDSYTAGRPYSRNGNEPWRAGNSDLRFRTFVTDGPAPSPGTSPSPLPSPTPAPSPSAAPATVTVQQSAGGTASITPPGPYTVGQQIQATATPNSGMLLVGWQGSGVVTGTGAQPIGAQGAAVSAFATGAQIGAWGNPLAATISNPNVTLKPIFAPRPTFGDVPAGDPAANAIAQLAARGVINGCDSAATPPRFCPGEPTFRHQMAALIVRAMPGWVDETGLPSFTDNTSDTELMTRVATVQRHNVARGYQDEVCRDQGKTPPCYGPLDSVKHGQVMLFIARAMVEKGYWTLQADDRAIFPDQNGDAGADPNTDQQTKDHRMVVTYVHYAGAPPDVNASAGTAFRVNGVAAGGWGDAASRGWFARALWLALDSYWGE